MLSIPIRSRSTSPDGSVTKHARRVLTEDLARELAAEVVSEPLLIPEVTVTAIEKARDPDDARFRPRELEVGVRAEDGTPHEVLRREHRDLVGEDDQVVDRSVGSRDDRTETLADVQAHHDAELGHRPEERVPVVEVVVAGQAHEVGQLGHRDRVAALGCDPAHLGRPWPAGPTPERRRAG